MEMTFRWYGESDPISLDYIRQIPGMKGIVSAIYDIPVGEVWPLEKIQALKSSIEEKGLELSVIESVPVHEDIKTGKPTRDKYIENYKTTLKNLGEAGIPVVCYNFMPVFDWTRSDLAFPLPDGSNALIFDEEQVNKMDPRTLSLPGWDESYTSEEMNNLMDEYKSIDDEKLWENLEYFIKGIILEFLAAALKLAEHVFLVCTFGKLLKPITHGQPYDGTVSKTLRKLGVGCILICIVENVLSYLQVTRAYWTLREIKRIFLPVTVTGIDIQSGINLGTLVIGVLILIFSLVFRYGEELQVQADETL